MLIDDAVEIVIRMQQFTHVAIQHPSIRQFAPEHDEEGFGPAQLTLNQVPVEQRSAAIAEQQLRSVAQFQSRAKQSCIAAPGDHKGDHGAEETTHDRRCDQIA